MKKNTSIEIIKKVKDIINPVYNKNMKVWIKESDLKKIDEYTCDYGDFIITYCIERDIDGSVAVIKTIDGITDFELNFDLDTINDIKFICVCDFQDKQFTHYMKTGDTGF